MKKYREILPIASAVFFLVLFSSLSPAAPLKRAAIEASAAKMAAASSGEVTIIFHHLTDTVKFIGTEPNKPIIQDKDLSKRNNTKPPAFDRSARDFINNRRVLFGIDDADTDLTVKQETTNESGYSFVRFQQTYRGVPVFGGEIVIQHDIDRNIVAAISKAIPEIQIDTTPLIEPLAAKEIAEDLVAKQNAIQRDSLFSSNPDLVIYNPTLFNIKTNRNYLTYRIEVFSDGFPPAQELVFIDAHTGKVVLHFNNQKTALYRKIYDNRDDPSAGIPGYGPVRVEGQGPTGIVDVDYIYDVIGDSYVFFWNYFGRDSVDGAGMPLAATARYCQSGSACPYNNAFWSGYYKQFVAGSVAVTDDTVAHELGHGFSHFSSHFFYFMQSGAIEESMADVWGEFVDLTNGRGDDSPGVRWLLFEDDTTNGALRSMLNPNQFKDPAKMTDDYYYCGIKDNGGVHTNNGVGNKAASLITDGGSFNGYTVRGLGMWKTAQIYYEYQTHLAVSGADYEDLHYGLYQAALNLIGLHGITPDDCDQVWYATVATEMHKRESWCVYADAPICETGSPSDIFLDTMEGDSLWEFIFISGAQPKYLYFISYAKGGKYSLLGENMDKVSDFALAMKSSVLIPSGSTVYMHFDHSYQFEMENSTMYDGGVLEYSVDNGANWFDTDGMFTHNGYDGNINSGDGNPLSGRSAFTGTSFGYTSSRLDITSLAGRNVKFRFRVGNDEAVGDKGWYIDNVRIYTCQGSFPACAATLSGDMRIHVPFIDATPSHIGSLWADFEHVPTSDGIVWFKVTGHGAVSDSSKYSTCEKVTLSPDLTLYVPEIVSGNTSYWLYMKYGVPWSTGEVAFRVLYYGAN